MSAMETAPLKTLDVAYVSQVVRALLNEAGRQILVEDGPRQDLVPIPFDAAAAEDGLLPVFLVAGEAIWRDVTGRGFELKLKRDLGALLSWRIEAIEAETFSCVLLSVMEAIAQVAGPEGVMVLDLARVFDEATARTEARRRLARRALSMKRHRDSCCSAFTRGAHPRNDRPVRARLGKGGRSHDRRLPQGRGRTASRPGRGAGAPA